tara:strand:- start:213 stop:1754 length:1542 start_codon:yes stop_codon:yes gene_type:complete
MSLLEELEAKKGKKNLLQELEEKKTQSLSGSEVLTQAVQNLPSSAVQLASDITMPIRHPIQTVQSLASLGRGVYQLATPGEQPDEATAKAVGQFFADRYGSLEGFKNAFAKDPLGIISDVSVVLTGGAGLVAKVPGLAGKTTSTISKVGNVIDPVLASGKAISATAQGAGKVIAPLLGVTTGSGGDAIKVAYQSGGAGGDTQKVFTDNLRGKVPVDDILPQAFDAIKDMSRSKGRAYREGMDVVKAAQSKVDFSGIEKAYQGVLDEFTIKTKQGNVLKGGADLQKKFDEINELINTWKQNPDLHLAENVDALKQAVDSLWKPGKDAVVVTKVRNAIHKEIVKQVPKYAETMQAYEQAIKLEKEIMRELSLNRTAAAGTTLRKLQSVMRNNVNTNYGNRLEMLKNLDPDLLPAISGQALSSKTPRGLQGITFTGQMGAGAFGYADPLTLALTMPLQSPRLVGEAALKTGQASRALKPLQSPTALQLARASRVAGELERASPSEKQRELLRLLSK